MSGSLNALNEAMNVHVVDGDVVILGPDGIAVSLTAAAAEESARRLAKAAQAAQAHRRWPLVEATD
jgi:hypothetical protein